LSRESHWNEVWSKNREGKESWFQERPSLSLDLIQRHTANRSARILDVGGGSSLLAETLLADGFEHIGVLDIAASALERARNRMGNRDPSVEWIAGDVTAYEPSLPWDLWHDRAVFHFLVDADDQESYMRSVRRSLSPTGIVVISTFGPDGPEKCSGLNVKCHSPESLGEAFGSGFALLESHIEMHRTPNNTDQQFVYCVFRRDW